MSEKNNEVLARITTGVFERFAFMFVEEPEENSLEWRGDYLFSTITFEGPSKGALSVMAPEPLCRELAANVLGVDEDDADDAITEDALKELSNIILGELVAELFGTEAVFNLTVPSLFRVDRSKWQELCADTDNVHLLVEDQPVLVNLVTIDSSD